MGAWLLAGVDSPQKHREQMVFSEVCKWAVVFGLLCLRSTGAEVTWSLLENLGFALVLLCAGGVAVMVIGR